MPATYRSASSDIRGTSTNTVAAKPSGVVSGDLLIAIHGSDRGSSYSSMTAPSGWASEGQSTQSNAGFVKVWSKIAGGSEPSSYTFPDDTGADAALIIIAVQAGTFDPTTPLAAISFGGSNSSSTSHVAPSVTGVTDGLLVCGFFGGAGANATRTYTPPSGMTERAECSANLWVVSEAATAGLASNSATGTKTATCSASVASVTVSIVVAPASVPQSLTLPGIPSAEAVGTGALRPGLGLPGIPSAEAVGVPKLRMTIAPPGIGGAEAVGIPYVVRGKALQPPGVPSAETVGTGAVAPGPVSLTLPGVPSAEAIGDAEIKVVFDPDVRGTGRIARRDIYELVCVARIPTASGAPTFFEVERIEWRTLSWSTELSGPQSLVARCPVAAVAFPVAQRLAGPDRLATELWLTRNGQRVFAGPLIGWRRSGDDVDITAAGLMAYLQVMIVLDDVRFDQQDQHTIARQLVDQWQTTIPYGNFGIDTSSVTPSGTLRNRTYVRNEINQVSRRVQELGAVDGGFDAEVDPTTRKLQLWTPTLGVDRSSGGDAIVLDDRNINSLDVMCSVAPGDLASMAFGASTASGADTSLWAQAVNEDLRAAYGAAAVTGSWSDVSEQSTLDGHVAALLAARDRALLVPGPRARVTTDSDLGSYDVGDTIACEMDSLLGVSGAFRIRKRLVDVSESGEETATLEFV